MTDPRVISIISIIFAAIGSYSLYTSIKRIREARLAGNRMRLYKQISFLTGLEYILLTFVFPLSLINRPGNAPQSVTNLTIPLYIILLVCAAIIAGLVIHRGILNMLALRARRLQAIGMVRTPTQATIQVQTKDDTRTQTQRQRERRKNAAAARRRRAGKA